MSDTGSAAATATTASTTAATGDTAAATTAPAFDWTKHGLDADASTYVAGKGWKGPGDLVNSYRNAEKLIGIAPEKVIKPPGGDYNQQIMNEQVYDRLGRPKDVTGYEPAKWVAAGGDAKFAESAAGWFHEAGLNPQQAQFLAGKWNEHAKGLTTTSTQASETKNATEIAALKGSWGQAFDSNSALVDKAAATFGMSPEMVAALKTAAGPKAAMEFLFNVGQKMGVSDSFIDADGRQTNFAGGMTGEQAKMRIADLKKDQGFMHKYTHGDADAKQQMTDLMRRAHPGQLTL